jgi:proline iminopeptidase
MHIDVNGTRLWFDVDGPVLVPDGATMRERDTFVLIHGGPGSYDHSYFKPHFVRLRDVGQLVYLDLRDFGRSARHDPNEWSFELCADDVAAFCAALGIQRPIVLGHSMGGFIALLLAIRHSDVAGALVLMSTMARLDMDRLVESFREVADDRIAEIARRDFSGEASSDEELAAAFAAFGPNVPEPDELARRIGNPEIGGRGSELLLGYDVLDQLGQVACPTLVLVGDKDPVAPIDAANEIMAALPMGIGHRAVIHGAGHFPWLDAPERTFGEIADFVKDLQASVRRTA